MNAGEAGQLLRTLNRRYSPAVVEEHAATVMARALQHDRQRDRPTLVLYLEALENLLHVMVELQAQLDAFMTIGRATYDQHHRTLREQYGDE